MPNADSDRSFDPFEELTCIDVTPGEGMVRIEQPIGEVALYSPEKAREAAHRIINAADVADEQRRTREGDDGSDR